MNFKVDEHTASICKGILLFDENDMYNFMYRLQTRVQVELCRQDMEWCIADLRDSPIKGLMGAIALTEPVIFNPNPKILNLWHGKKMPT